jgi:mono/diheme cytochrome c family protein
MKREHIRAEKETTMGEERKKWKVVLYSSIGIFIVVVLSAIVIQLIIDIWRPPFLYPRDTFFGIRVTNNEPAQVAQMRAATQGLPFEGVVAYRNATDDIQRTRFHDWEIPAPIDSVSTCVSCHGNMPHIKDVRVRAFLNKHVMHMACETCHMPASSNYGWYNIKTGEIRSSIALGEPLLVSAFKLAPITSGQANFARSDAMATARTFLREAGNLSVAERRTRLNAIHGNKSDAKPSCVSCHSSDVSASRIPLERVGYTPARARQIVGNEAALMIENYPGYFFLPNFLMRQGDN